MTIYADFRLANIHGKITQGSSVRVEETWYHLGKLRCPVEMMRHDITGMDETAWHGWRPPYGGIVWCGHPWVRTYRSGHYQNLSRSTSGLKGAWTRILCPQHCPLARDDREGWW